MGNDARDTRPEIKHEERDLQVELEGARSLVKFSGGFVTAVSLVNLVFLLGVVGRIPIEELAKLIQSQSTKAFALISATSVSTIVMCAGAIVSLAANSLVKSLYSDFWKVRHEDISVDDGELQRKLESIHVNLTQSWLLRSIRTVHYISKTISAQFSR